MKCLRIICRVVIIAGYAYLAAGCAGSPAIKKTGQAAEVAGAVILTPLVAAFYVLGTDEPETAPEVWENRYYRLAEEEIYRQRWKNGSGCDLRPSVTYRPYHGTPENRKAPRFLPRCADF